MSNKKNLVGMTLAELQQVTVEVGMPMFAAKQMADWLYVKQVSSIDQMTNISLKLRERLAESYEIGLSAPEHKAASADGTVKPGGLQDGLRVLHDRPSALYRQPYRG